MSTKRILVGVITAMAAHYAMSQFLAAATRFAEDTEERDLGGRLVTIGVSGADNG